eukprot:SAG31_NODE_29497_length_394_cov_1.023729_1_plen_58_part_01
MVWFKFMGASGVTYTIETRLGASTFTWLYLLGQDGDTLEQCVYCRPDADVGMNSDRSS